jgi:hypothetical protein
MKRLAEPIPLLLGHCGFLDRLNDIQYGDYQAIIVPPTTEDHFASQFHKCIPRYSTGYNATNVIWQMPSIRSVHLARI